jgi:multidrug efflux system outer membrane protein
MRTRKFLAVPLLVTLWGCLPLKSPPEQSEIVPQALPNLGVPATFDTATEGWTPVTGNWLAEFADPKLEALIAEAVRHNPDLRVAAARVAVASGYVQVANSKLYPQVKFLGRAGGEMSGDSSGLQGAGIWADWEWDLWGKIRSAKAANVAAYESTVADTEYARQSIAALVAKSYFLAIEASKQQTLAEQMVTAAEQLETLAQQRQTVGRGDGYDVALARANAETFRDSVLQLSLARDQSLRAIETRSCSSADQTSSRRTGAWPRRSIERPKRRPRGCRRSR